MLANSIQHWFYRHLAKPYFFRHDPEDTHDRIANLGKKLGRYAIARHLIHTIMAYDHPALEQTILGIRFANPIGLSGGFDKNAELTQIIPAVGFGFMEVGSITGEPCVGNPKPRLWRLPKSQALAVYYGLKNDGCEKIAERLKHQRCGIPLGINIAKTNNAQAVDVTAGIADYNKSFQALAQIGDYFTINISCPNAYGGQPFCDPSRLDALLTVLDTQPTTKPIFLKLDVDLSIPQVDALRQITDRHRVHGFIVGNLTKQRTLATIDQAEIQAIPAGGISGKPTFALSNAIISHLYKTVGKKNIIIGTGGIFSAADAYQKICAGASLVQLITGMIFEGPQLIGAINYSLVKLLRHDGFKNIAQAVGSKV